MEIYILTYMFTTANGKKFKAVAGAYSTFDKAFVASQTFHARPKMYSDVHIATRTLDQ